MGIDVTASDYHPLAQEFLDENILGNDLPPIKFETGNWDVDNPLLGEFDVIIGSDILYEPAHAENVSRFIDNHSGHDVQVIIVDPDRGNRSRFTRFMHSLGYAHHFDRFSEQQDDGSTCKGRVLHYQR